MERAIFLFTFTASMSLCHPDLDAQPAEQTPTPSKAPSDETRESQVSSSNEESAHDQTDTGGGTGSGEVNARSASKGDSGVEPGGVPPTTSEVESTPGAENELPQNVGETQPVTVAETNARAEPEAAPAPLGEAATLTGEPHPAEEMPGNQRITWDLRRQVPFVRNGGLLNRKETAIMLYVDGELFPPALMINVSVSLSSSISFVLGLMVSSI